MGAYDRDYHRGKLFNKRTIAMLKRVEAKTPISTYYQGSYNHGVGASAGTHDGGGAVDLWGSNADDIVREMRKVGFAAWIRSPSQGPWPYHIHAIAIGDKELAPLAKSQVSSYYAGRNGLASNGYDYHWRPSPIPVFKYGKSRRRVIVDSSRVLRQFRLKVRDKTPLPMVKALQRALNAKANADLLVDGRAGEQTRAAFRRYRQNHKLGPFNAIRRLGKGRFRTKR